MPERFPDESCGFYLKREGRDIVRFICELCGAMVGTTRRIEASHFILLESLRPLEIRSNR